MKKILTRVQHYLTPGGTLCLKDIPIDLTKEEFDSIPENYKILFVDGDEVQSTKYEKKSKEEKEEIK